MRALTHSVSPVPALVCSSSCRSSIDAEARPRPRSEEAVRRSVSPPSPAAPAAPAAGQPPNDYQQNEERAPNHPYFAAATQPPAGMV